MPSRDFPADPQSLHDVRAFLREHLGEGSWEAEVVATELAANVVVHAHTEFTVHLEVGDVVELSVQDGSSVRPAVRDVISGSGGGWGLRVVERLSGAWGYEETEAGKRVWARLSRETETVG